MTERDLLKQLHNLRVSVKPNADWKARGRDVLLNQISHGEPLNRVGRFVIFKDLLPLKFLPKLSQPAWAVILIVLAVLGGGVASLRAARDTAPGDSFYIAKILGERTRAVFTFDEKAKTKLSVEFAGNRVREMARVADGENGGRAEKMEKLTNDFRKEMMNIKTKTAKKSSVNKPASEEEGEEIFGANLGKDDKGMQIAEPARTETQNNAATSSDNAGEASGNGAPAATTTVSGESSTSASTDELQETLAEAEKLFDEKNYDATVDKLKEANEMVR